MTTTEITAILESIERHSGIMLDGSELRLMVGGAVIGSIIVWRLWAMWVRASVSNFGTYSQ